MADLESKVSAELSALEETLWRAETRYDRALMEQIFADDFVEIGRSGRRYERSEMFFDRDDVAPINATFPLPDYSVTLVAPGVALATYTSELLRNDVIEKARRSSLWIKVHGQWRLKFHQGTAL